MTIRNFCFIVLCSLWSAVIHAGEVVNVRYYQVSDEKIVVYYDLTGNTPEDVDAFFTSGEGGNAIRIETGLTGDIGEDIAPGTYRRFEWTMSAGDKTRFEGIVVRIRRAGAESTPVPTAAEIPDSPMIIKRLTSPVKFDGMPDEQAWEGIEPLPVVMQTPTFGIEPSEKTEILIGYDDNYLYVGGRMYESDPDGIHMTTMKRDDDEGSSDFFGILLDTFNDNENALTFATTPSGSRVDKSIYGDMLGGGSASGGSNSSWNTFWDVETVRNDKGWFAEMRIPISSLRFQESDNDVVMGISAYRWIARKDERIVFPAVSQEWGKNSHLKPSKARDAVFSGIRSHRPLYITPYVLGGIGQVYELNDTGTDYERDDEPAREAGLDLKYGLTSNMTLDLTYNTDFAQVEADDQQVNLTRYSLFFPEKRLFFLERESNFDFRFYGRNRLFHSRRIGIHEGKQVPIYGGARVYGRAGRWDLGFLSMQTEKTDDLPSENFGVIRMRRQVFNPYSYLGYIVTSRMGNDGTYNTAYGLDGTIRVFGDDILKFNWAQTFENDADNDPADIDISKIRVHWERYRHVGWAYGLNYSRSGEKYNPGMGFEQYENSTSYIHFARYGWMGDSGSRWFQYEVYEDLWLHYWNSIEGVKSCLARTGGHGTTKAGFGVSLSATYNYEDVRDILAFSDGCDVPVGTYEFYGLKGSFSTPGGRLLRVSTSFEGGEFYDGRRLTLSVSPSRSISSHLEVGGTYEVNMVDFSERDQEFNSHIGRLRLLAMLNVKFSVNAFVQYNSAVDTVINNIRFRYNPREGNDFYLVYDEAFNMDREREIPTLPQTKNRTVLLKYNYTFNL